MIKSLVSFFNVDGLLKDSSILFVGMAVAQVFNLIFQMFMGRTLQPEEFALLISLLGLFNMLSFPLGVFSAAITRFSSLLITEGRSGDVRRLVLRWGGRMFLAGLVLSGACVLFSSSIAGFLHLQRVAPVYVFSASSIAVFCTPVVTGALLGTQRFKTWCVGISVGAMVRVGLGVVLVSFISPFAGWGLLAHGLGLYAMILCGGMVLALGLKGSVSSGKPLPRMQDYLWGSFLIMLGYAVLMTGDVVLVKHLLPESAGDFAYAAILARLVLFLPQSLVGSMFPKVVAGKQGTARQLRLFRRTLLAALLGASATALAFTVLARLLPHLLFGIDEPSDELVRWLRTLSWIMVPVALLSVMMRYALAQHRFFAAAVIPIAALCYIVGAFGFSKSPDSILLILGCVSLGALLVMASALLKIREEEAPS